MEITFSKNGKPMGRTKSTMVRKNKQWTAEEDNYIRIAVQEGLSTAAVSARLGRSVASISGRKWALGIEGRLASSKGKKGTKMNRHSIAGTQSTPSFSFGAGILELESGIPMPTKHSRNEEVRNKMRNLFDQMRQGQSFVVPKNLLHVANHLAKKEFSGYKTRATATSQDKKFYRIFRVL